MSLIVNEIIKENQKLNNLILNNGLGYGKSKLINAVVYFFKKKILKIIKNNFFSLKKNFIPRLIKDKKVSGEKIDSFFIDIGTYKNLHYAKKFLQSKTRKKAAFFDRDGVINYDYGHVYKINDLRFRKNVIKALKYLYKRNYQIFIITNQAGIGKKIYTYDEFVKFQLQMYKKLSDEGVYITNTEFCPHHPKAKIKKFKKNCSCRKPKNQMIKNILSNYNIDFKNSFMIGDQLSDKLCADKSNLKFFYVENDLFKQLKLLEII